eukprot:SAG31_NODE_31799_length_364_cov_0.584906_1_plen_61_part_10
MHACKLQKFEWWGTHTNRVQTLAVDKSVHRVRYGKGIFGEGPAAGYTCTVLDAPGIDALAT